MIYQIINIIITASYFLLILSFIIGWLNIEKHKNKPVNYSALYVSVVIALKNEESNINSLMQSLNNQSFSKDYFEIILVNDHSRDSTLTMIKKHAEKFENMQVFELKNHMHGKKAALHYGISQSKGKLIVCTDADCTHHTNWLETIVNYYLNNKAKMIVAPVLMNSNNTFESIQSLDFFSLMTSGAAATGINQPIMCNGANLAFEKSAYQQINNPHNDKYISGDDVFLLLNFKKKHRKEIKFLKSTNAIVFTQAQKSFKSLMKQRIRWASKSSGYTDIFIILTSIIVLLVNLSLLINFILSWLSNSIFNIFIYQFIAKSLIDIVFLSVLSIFFNNIKQIIWFLPTQIANILMIPYLAFSGLFSSTK